jgi:hypothetical protein
LSRTYSHAVLGEVIASAKDSDEAVIQAIAGMQQGEEDRAPYCSPDYVAMEAGASWLLLGHPRSAIPILEKGHSEWLDNSQMRDYALCVSRLAAAYAAAGELEQACAAAEEAKALAQGLGRAAWLARSTWFIVGSEDGGRIPPSLACEGV